MTRLRRIYFLAGFVLLVGACQQKPTKVFQTVPTQIKNESASGASALVITEQTVIVDARPSFEYAISHLNGAINLRPEEFNQQEQAFRGVLDVDKFFHARKLARLGIGPDTPVIVVGRGLRGNGEEGRVAWTLKVFGLKNVNFSSLDFFSLPLTTAEAPPKTPVPMWKPEVDETLVVEKAEFLKAVHIPSTALSRPLVIDVRSAEEYLGKAKVFNQPVPDLAAINIPWNEFFDDKGLVKFAMQERLNSVGISKDRMVYVISNKGIESAAVTLALRELSYNQAANFSGGYQELIFGGTKAKAKK